MTHDITIYFVETVEYIKSYRYLIALCWKLWIQSFSTDTLTLFKPGLFFTV